MAYTKTTWVSGVAPPISAANLNNLETQYESIVADFALGLSVVKTTDEDVTSSDVMQNDNELVIPVEANTDYAIVGIIVAESASSTPSIDFTFTVPAAITAGGWAHDNIGTGATLRAFATEGGMNLTAAQVRFVAIWGYLQNGANAGNLQFQWAQETSDGTATTVKAGSSLTVYR